MPINEITIELSGLEGGKSSNSMMKEVKLAFKHYKIANIEVKRYVRTKEKKVASDCYESQDCKQALS